jgi:hypothetical protein
MSGARNFTEDVVKATVAAMRNALAPRGGVAFDGTASSRVTSTLTGQSIGTDPFSLGVVFTCPTSAPAAPVTIAGLTGDPTTFAGVGGRFEIQLRADGGLSFLVSNIAVTTLRDEYIPNFVTTYGGKAVHVVFTRSGAVGVSLVNGVALPRTISISTCDYSEALVSTYLGIGFRSSSAVLAGKVHSATLYNLALSAADVQEIYELGGGVPERYKFGTQNAKYTSDFSAGTDSWAEGDGTPTLAGNQDGVGGVDDAFKFTAIATRTNTLIRGNGLNVVGVTSGKLYRVSWSQYWAGNTTCVGVALTGPNAGALTDPLTGSPFGVDTSAAGAWENKVRTILVPSTIQFRFEMRTSADGIFVTIGDSVYLKNVKFTQVGAVVHLPLNDGIGYQLRDASTNKLHALMTTTGVSHILPINGPARLRATSNTNGNQQLLGAQNVLPETCQILRVRARSLSGTPTVTLGTASGGSQIVTSVALSTTWKNLTIALTDGILSAESALWAGSNSTDVVEWDIQWEPLSS